MCLHKRADVRAGGLGAASSCGVLERRSLRAIVVVDAMPAALLAQDARAAAARSVGSSRRTCGRSTAPARAGRSSPAARRSTRPRLRRSHRDGPCARRSGNSETVRAAAAERGLLLGKHRRDLPLRRAVDARVGPARLPAIQIRLRFLEALEALPFQRRLLRVADAGFDLAFAIGIADAARQRDDAVVRQHIAIERIERGIVDVGREHAFAQIVEDDHARAPPSRRNACSCSSAQICALESQDQQPHRFAGVAQRQDEEPRAPVLARCAIAHHRAVAVVDLAFFIMVRAP